MFCGYSYCHQFFKHQISKSYKEEKIDSSNTQIDDRALAWLCTGTAIKKHGSGGGIGLLVLCVQTSSS